MVQGLRVCSSTTGAWAQSQAKELRFLIHWGAVKEKKTQKKKWEKKKQKSWSVLTNVNSFLSLSTSLQRKLLSTIWSMFDILHIYTHTHIYIHTNIYSLYIYIYIYIFHNTPVMAFNVLSYNLLFMCSNVSETHIFPGQSMYTQLHEGTILHSRHTF